MKCRHPKCNCQTGSGNEFCSTDCESDLADEGATDCHCGHAECLGTTESNRDSDR
jgi:hypothetical protein